MIKKILIILIKKIRVLRRNLKWLRQALRIKRNFNVTNVKQFETFNTRSLIITPHSDDEWIGCAKLMEESQGLATLIYLGFSETEKLDSIVNTSRMEETMLASQKMQCNFIDGSNNSIETIVNCLTREKPQVVFIPYIIDWHEEHIKAMKYLYEAIKILQIYNMKIGMYQVSVPICKDDINQGIPLNKCDFKLKWALIKKIYKTQKGIAFYRFALNEYINGKAFNSYAAESYCILDVYDWINRIDKCKMDYTDVLTLKENLNDLYNIRKITSQIYRKYSL